MEELLHQLIDSLSHYLQDFTYSQVVLPDFFHQEQYLLYATSYAAFFEALCICTMDLDVKLAMLGFVGIWFSAAYDLQKLAYGVQKLAYGHWWWWLQLKYFLEFSPTENWGKMNPHPFWLAHIFSNGMVKDHQVDSDLSLQNQNALFDP